MDGHDPTASGAIGVLANAAVGFVGSALVVPTPTLGKRGSRWTDAFPGGLDRAGMADRFSPEVMAGSGGRPTPGRCVWPPRRR